MNRRLLIIFVRNPLSGKVKTRLARTLGPKAALEIYQELVRHTHHITASLPVDRVVFYSDVVEDGDLWKSPPYLKQVQQGHDLGARMEHAFSWGFRTGYRQICIIGSDCYELTGEILMHAFELLDNHEVVLGPSRDGGYYLLGLKKVYKKLFRGKEWSTPTVAEATLADFRKLDLDHHCLPTLNDVDTEQDLPATLKQILSR